MHAAATVGFTPRNVSVFLIVNSLSKVHRAVEPIMAPTDEGVRHRSLKAPDSSAADDGSLAVMQLALKMGQYNTPMTC